MNQKKDSRKTKIIRIEPDQMDDSEFSPALQLLKNGEVVGFPTETVYGLGGLITQLEAIHKIFEAKNRPADNPLIVHISEFEMLQDLVLEISPQVKKLCQKFWPGPLTVLFEKSNVVPDLVTADLPTVAVRLPAHRVARRLISLAGAPVAAPSANLSGRPSPTTAEHVYHDLKGKIPLIIDSGKCELGVESTVIDVNKTPPLLLRPGGLNYEELKRMIPGLELLDSRSRENSESEKLIESPSTPGLKYKHYSPGAYVILIKNPTEKSNRDLEKTWKKYNQKEKKIGWIHTRAKVCLPDKIKQAPRTSVIDLADAPEIDDRENNLELVARELFSSLRSLDGEGAEVIIVEGTGYKKEGLAVMNRLEKAASEII